MARYRSSAIAFAALLTFCRSISLGGEAPQLGPRLEVEKPPECPAQHTPWSAPKTRLPEGLVSATRILFEQGLSDPRGCEYRSIDIAIGDCWSGGGRRATVHGWVLPSGGSAQRFAVCWNGLVYPIASVGTRGDLKADLKAAIAAERGRMAGQKNARIRFTSIATCERDSTSEATLLPLKVCLLLRLNEVELAEQTWFEWSAGDVANKGRGDDPNDPYLVLASDWTWALFDRAVCAHMRQDDRLSLASASQLLAIAPHAEGEAARRGFAKPSVVTSEEFPYLGFLQPLRALLADQERRKLDRGKDQDIKPVSLDKAGVPELIRRLEEIDARQWGQPGGVSLVRDPIFTSLTSKGIVAVEPLIACLENDERLTRSVSFHRDFFRQRKVIRVRAVAFLAISTILSTSHFPGPSPTDFPDPTNDDWRKIAAAVRTHWEKTRDLPQAEGWYLVLADDHASNMAWLEAATNIARPTDGLPPLSSMRSLYWLDVPTTSKAVAPRLAGESLRKNKSPPVSDLLVRRMAAEQSFMFAVDFAMPLAVWDPGAARPELRNLLMRMLPVGEESLYRNARDIGRLTLAAVYTGADDALDRYALWIRRTSPDQLVPYMEIALLPLARYPDRPAILKTSRWMFLDRASPWNPLLFHPGRRDVYWGDTKLLVELLRVPAFRGQMLEQLRRTEQAGTLEVISEGYRYSAGGLGGFSSVPQSDPDLPPKGTKVVFRINDYCAWLLSECGGPPIKIFSSIDKRNAAIDNCGQFLRRRADQQRVD